MGPELPSDPGEEDLRLPEPLHMPMPSDESDNDSIDTYNRGYQPLSTGDSLEVDINVQNESNDDVATRDEISSVGANISPRESEVSNITQVDTVDIEIEREVWNAPRPQELQLELDNTRTAQILNAMANISLPNISVPDWANGVPEERWKEELLQRIRQRKDSSIPVIQTSKK